MSIKKTAELTSNDVDVKMELADSDSICLDSEITRSTKTEIHFCYCFHFRGDPKTLLQSDSKNSAKWQPMENEMLLGNDGHLLFEKPEVSIELTTIPTLESTKYTSAQYRPSATLLPVALSIDNINLSLSQVILRLYKYGIGIFRFAIEFPSTARLQSILNVQNACMRTGSYSGKRLRVQEKGGYDFMPGHFVNSVLNAILLPNSWHPDKRTDRLAVYTLAAFETGQISQQKTGKTAADIYKAIVYKIGQMEDQVEAPLDAAYLEDFYHNHVYSRYATRSGGIMSTYHIDGGATVFFCPNAATAKLVPIKRQEREAKAQMCFGTNRPLVGMAIFEPYLFHRLFLRRMDDALYDLINYGTPTADSSEKLKDTHLQNLQYKAIFQSKDVSSTRSGKEQFAIHVSIGQLQNLYDRLSDTIEQLYNLYNAVEESRSQSRLDSLSIVFGMLGVAGLVLDFYSYYKALRVDEDANWMDRIVPVAIDGVLLFGAAIWIQRMRL